MRERKHYKVSLVPHIWGSKYIVLEDIDSPLTLVDELNRKMFKYGFSLREVMGIEEYENKE
tara:strand:+ start:311 stop:493 length:183 start_codon:yes stop_codon:yes gene_type:complete